MATDFTVFSRQYMKSDPHDSDIKVLPAYIPRQPGTSETNTLVPIPWENVRLVKAVACVAVAVNAVAWEIDLELNAAAGTEMMSISVAKSAAVGAIYESTTTTESACQNLSAAIATRDAICVEQEAASGTPTGAVNLYFIFEPELDVV